MAGRVTNLSFTFITSHTHDILSIPRICLFDHNKNISEGFYTADRKNNTPNWVAAVIRKTKQNVRNFPLKYFPCK
jgi:hypothetical protein